MNRAARWCVVGGILAVFAFGLQAPAIVVDDSPTYLAPARSLARGEGLREADGRPLEYRLPAYPVALGVTMAVFGESRRAFSLLNAALHISAVLLVLATIVRRSPTFGPMMAAIALVYPPYLTATGLVLQESLVELAVAAVFAACWRLAERPTLLRALIAGGSIGLAALAKTTALPLLAPFAVLAARRSRSLRFAGWFLAGAALVLMPWALRNAVVLGRMEVTNNNAGHTLLGGTVSNRIESWDGFAEYRAARTAWQREGHRNEPVLDRYLVRVALRRILEDPIRWAALCVERAARFMLPPRTWFVQVGLSEAGTLSPLYATFAALNVGLFGLAAWLGVNAMRTRDAVAGVAPLIVFGHQAVYALTYTSPRYAVTVGPVLFAAAGLALEALWHQRSGAAPAAT